MMTALEEARTGKYRKLPRAYDLRIVTRYLAVLHGSPIPLREIEDRKLEASISIGRITAETGEAIRQWKVQKGLENSDESEYRYLLRDLGVIDERDVDSEVEREIPIGGDGPAIGTLVQPPLRGGLYVLSGKGEELYRLHNEDRPSYLVYLFWLILRNQAYLPLVQQAIISRESYAGKGLSEVMQTADSTSLNCALSWMKYFGIAKCGKSTKGDLVTTSKSTCKLDPATLATYLLGAAILELGETFPVGEDYYVKEIGKRLSEAFSLNPSAVDFVRALDLIFRFNRLFLKGYASSRGDVSLPNFPRISMIRLEGRIPLTLLSNVSREDLLKITKYAR